MTNEFKNVTDVQNAVLETLSKVHNGDVVDVPTVLAEIRLANASLKLAVEISKYNVRMRYTKKVKFLETE